MYIVMKKYLLLIISFLSVFYITSYCSAALDGLKKDTIWNQEQHKAIVEVTSDNPIRDGMYWTINNDPSSVQGVIDDKIETHSWALDSTMNLIQIIINYSLGILAFIALIYLVYCGFLMLSSAGNDKQYDKGKAWIKVAAIALIGIGLSWLIVSLILRFIVKLTSY